MHHGVSPRGVRVSELGSSSKPIAMHAPPGGGSSVWLAKSEVRRDEGAAAMRSQLHS